MRISFFTPHVNAGTSRDTIARACDIADKLGADTLWSVDHIAFPYGFRAVYPYATHEFGESPDTPLEWWDCLSVLTFLGPIGITAGYNDRTQPKASLYYNDVYRASNEDTNVSSGTVCLQMSGVTTLHKRDGKWVQNGGECEDPTFQPARRKRLSDKIVLLFSIGQAF